MYLKPLLETEYDLFKKGQYGNKPGSNFKNFYAAAERRLVHMESSSNELIKEMCKIEKYVWEELKKYLIRNPVSPERQIDKTIGSKTFNLIDNLYASICSVVKQFKILFTLLDNTLACKNIKQERIVVVKKEYEENLKTLDKNSKNLFDILKKLRRPDLLDHGQKLVDDTVKYLSKFINENKKYAKSANSLI